MNRYEIDEQQLQRLKDIAVALRADNVPAEALAQYGYSIESVIGECELAPIADDESQYGKSSDPDDEPENEEGGSEEEL